MFGATSTVPADREAAGHTTVEGTIDHFGHQRLAPGNQPELSRRLLAALPLFRLFLVDKVGLLALSTLLLRNLGMSLLIRLRSRILGFPLVVCHYLIACFEVYYKRRPLPSVPSWQHNRIRHMVVSRFIDTLCVTPAQSTETAGAA
jgi:hypothetical protein